MLTEERSPSFAGELLGADATITNVQDDASRAPYRTRVFGIEPCVGILRGYHSLDRNSEFGSSPTRGCFDGALVNGVNIPLLSVVVGVESNATKGSGDIDWEIA